MFPTELLILISKYVSLKQRLNFYLLNQNINKNFTLSKVDNENIVVNINFLNKHKNLKIINVKKIISREPIDFSEFTNLKEISTNIHEQTRIYLESIINLTKLEKLKVNLGGICDECNNHEIVHINEIKNEYLEKLVNLKYLYAKSYYVSTNITKIHHLIKLTYLNCGNTTMSDNDLINLINLKTLFVDYSTQIKNLNHLINLRELHCERSNVDNNGIKDLVKLEILYTVGSKISDVNHLKNLKTLSYKENMNSNGYSKINNIENLRVHNEYEPIDVTHLTKLKNLENYARPGVPIIGLENLHDVETMYMSRSMDFNNIFHMKKIKCLIPNNSVTNEMLLNFQFLEKLYLNFGFDTQITDVSKLKNIKYVSCGNMKALIVDESRVLSKRSSCLEHGEIYFK